MNRIIFHDSDSSKNTGKPNIIELHFHSPYHTLSISLEKKKNGSSSFFRLITKHMKVMIKYQMIW